jgi:hypothetical protein
MDMYGESGNSIPQKLVISVLELVFIILSWILLFRPGLLAFLPWLVPAPTAGAPRYMLIFAFNVLVFLRLKLTMFVLLKRHIPWAEALNIPFAFALYYLGFALPVQGEFRRIGIQRRAGSRCSPWARY